MANGGGTNGAHASEEERQRPLEILLDEAIDEAGEDKLRVDDLFSAYGTRSFGPLIAILGLIAMSPIGAVPGLPAVLGILISLMSVQILVGRQDPWVPNRIKQLGFAKKKATEFRKNYGKWLERIDGLIQPRLEWAAGPAAQWLAAFLCIGLSLLMGPLEAIPFAVAVPAAAVMMFGLGLTSRDGLLMLLGFFITGLSIFLAYHWLSGGAGSTGDAESAALDLVAPLGSPSFGTGLAVF